MTHLDQWHPATAVLVLLLAMPVAIPYSGPIDRGLRGHRHGRGFSLQQFGIAVVGACPGIADRPGLRRSPPGACAIQRRAGGAGRDEPGARTQRYALVTVLVVLLGANDVPAQFPVAALGHW